MEFAISKIVAGFFFKCLKKKEKKKGSARIAVYTPRVTIGI